MYDYDEHTIFIITMCALVGLMYTPLPKRMNSAWVRAGIELTASVIVPVCARFVMTTVTLWLHPFAYGCPL
jgi:hypothetical protein